MADEQDSSDSERSAEQRAYEGGKKGACVCVGGGGWMVEHVPVVRAESMCESVCGKLATQGYGVNTAGAYGLDLSIT